MLTSLKLFIESNILINIYFLMREVSFFLVIKSILQTMTTIVLLSFIDIFLHGS